MITEAELSLDHLNLERNHFPIPISRSDSYWNWSNPGLAYTEPVEVNRQPDVFTQLFGKKLKNTTELSLTGSMRIKESRY
jgi:hypothetical protein